MPTNGQTADEIGAAARATRTRISHVTTIAGSGADIDDGFGSVGYEQSGDGVVAAPSHPEPRY